VIKILKTIFCITSFTCLLFLSPAGIAQTNQLISFKLEDQFERVYQDEDFRGHISYWLVAMPGEVNTTATGAVLFMTTLKPIQLSIRSNGQTG